MRATVAWYERIGFTTVAAHDDGGEGLSFAMMAFGPSEVMFSSGGRPSTQHRREVDLYVYTENVDALHERSRPGPMSSRDRATGSTACARSSSAT